MFVFWQFLQYAFPIVVKDHCIFHAKIRIFSLPLSLSLYIYTFFCLLSFIIHKNVAEMTAFVVFKDFICLWILPLETLFSPCDIIHIIYAACCYIPSKCEICKVAPDPLWLLLRAFHPHPLFAIYLNFVHLCLGVSSACHKGAVTGDGASRWHYHTNNQL